MLLEQLHRVPQLELCAAVDALLSAGRVLNELIYELNRVFYYSDSKVVMCYINNYVRSFQRYVARRVEIIFSVSSPNQWQYVSTNNNPADLASRSTDPVTLIGTMWLSGPSFLLTSDVDPIMGNSECVIIGIYLR